MQHIQDTQDTLMSSNYVSRWLRAMLTDPRLSLNEKGMGAILAHFATYETGLDCRPSNEHLIELANCSERNARRLRSTLIDAGWVRVVRRGNGRDTQLLQLTMADPEHYNLELWKSWEKREGGQICPPSADKNVLPDSTKRTNLSPQHGQICPVSADKNVPLPTHRPTQKPTQRESAQRVSRSVTHEQAREADALPSPSEQIGPEQQASELVTAEDASTVQAEVAPPVTGQALMGEGHSKASDTPELPEDMRRLRDELRAGREALAERDRHVASLPGPDVYLAELRELITVEHDLLWRSESAWHQLINNARRDGWTPAQLTERVHWCVVHYATARKAWRPQWLLSDVGRYDEGTAHVLNKAEAQHQRRVIESEGYLGQGQRRHAADLNDVGL